MTFYQHFVRECQVEHMRLLMYGWPVALLALLTGSVLMSMLGIIMLVMAWIGAPESLEIHDEPSSSPSED